MAIGLEEVSEIIFQDRNVRVENIENVLLSCSHRLKLIKKRFGDQNNPIFGLFLQPGCYELVVIFKKK